MDLDFKLTPSEEAKICLNCEQPKCIPSNCERFKQKMDELKGRGKSNETIPTSD